MRLMRDLVGDTLSGRYHMVSRVAGGGMGDVYRAQDLLLDRTVAIKVLQRSLANDPVLVERFKNEARAAARLTHPNVVAVYDWGTEEDLTYYMVMEYVAGTDLRDVLVGKGFLEPAQAVEVVASVCEALAAAHRSSLVHRDVKPENVLISRSGDVKVADFGIAAIADAERTMPGGHIPGTLRYLSPEQARGEDATPASDVWAAGALLSELLTGRLPLQGEGDLLRLRAHEEPMPPSIYGARLPVDLDDVVVRACALEPAERFQDAGSMAAALRRVAVRSLPEAASTASLLEDVTTEIRLPDAEPAPKKESRAVSQRRRRRRSRLRTIRAGLVLAALFALTWAGTKAVPAVLGPDHIPVPKLVGAKVAKADGRAQKLGLDLKVVGRHRVLGRPRGTVLSQRPAGGSLEEGSALRVVLSAGPPKVEVPSVEGFTLSAAGVRLRAGDLAPGRLSKSYSSQPEGVVVAQHPSSGKVERGATVRLVISKGPQPATLPNVAGLDLAKARATLKDAGFVTSVAKGYSNTVAPGTVIETQPTAGTVAQGGSVVQLLLSQGPQYHKVTMPDVRNLVVDRAKAKLTGLGLRVRVEQSCPGGTVVETDPIAGTVVREHDAVALFVC